MSEPIVFIPDILCDIRMFMPQIIALSHNFVMVSAPTGQLERIDETASEMLPYLPTKFALLGQGLGGAIALEILRRAPQRVTRVALSGTTPFSDSPAEAASREARIVAARSGRLESAIAEEFPSGAFHNTTRSEIINKINIMANSNGPDVYIRQSRAMQRRRDHQSILRKTHQPTVIIAGEHDTIIPVKRQEFMAELMPNAEITVIPDAGHLPSLENPAIFTEVIKAWMKISQSA